MNKKNASCPADRHGVLNLLRGVIASFAISKNVCMWDTLECCFFSSLRYLRASFVTLFFTNALKVFLGIFSMSLIVRFKFNVSMSVRTVLGCWFAELCLQERMYKRVFVFIISH